MSAKHPPLNSSKLHQNIGELIIKCFFFKSDNLNRGLLLKTFLHEIAVDISKWVLTVEEKHVNILHDEKQRQPLLLQQSDLLTNCHKTKIWSFLRLLHVNLFRNNWRNIYRMDLFRNKEDCAWINDQNPSNPQNEGNACSTVLHVIKILCSSQEIENH